MLTSYVNGPQARGADCRYSGQKVDRAPLPLCLLCLLFEIQIPTGIPHGGVNKQGGGGGGVWLHACKANAAPAPAASPASGSNLIGHGRWKVAASRSLFEKLRIHGAPLAF